MVTKSKQIHQRWTVEEAQFVQAAASTMSTLAMAEQLGRNPISVQNFCARNSIRVVKTTTFATKNIESPFIVGNRLLLAKTCTVCGRFLSAKHYTQSSSKPIAGFYRSRCKSCGTNYTKEYGNSKAGYAENVKNNKDKIQSYTKKLAHNSRKKWTGAEYDAVSDVNKSLIQVAVELGRTYNAVCNVASKLGVSRQLNPDQHKNWVILLNQISVEKALEMERAGLISREGVPVESEWEWSD